MKILYLILFLTLILFGCTFYQRAVGQVEFGNYTKNLIKKTIKTDGEHYTLNIKSLEENKTAFEFTDGTCWRKIIFSNERLIISPYCTDGRLAEEADVKQSKVSGKASWYDYSLKGYPNYSKENYTAASRDYPRGTRLRVCRIEINITRLNSGKWQDWPCVDVRVNDYGPEHCKDNKRACPERIIDLSSKAFAELADLKRGIIDVEIIKL